MFRKNFREGAKSSASGVKLTSKANRSQGKRSRDMGYGNLDADCHYRTHLFFSPNRGFNSNDCEGLCDFAMCLSMPFNLSPSLYFSSYSLCPPIYTYLSLSLSLCSFLFNSILLCTYYFYYFYFHRISIDSCFHRAKIRLCWTFVLSSCFVCCCAVCATGKNKYMIICCVCMYEIPYKRRESFQYQQLNTKWWEMVKGNHMRITSSIDTLSID